MEEKNLININTIHLLLGSNIRLTMTDGRVARGKFVCLDRLGNIMLENVIEYRRVAYIPPGLSERVDDNQKIKQWVTERSLSQAVIPGDRLGKVEIVKGEWEARVGQSSISLSE